MRIPRISVLALMAGRLLAADSTPITEFSYHLGTSSAELQAAAEQPAVPMPSFVVRTTRERRTWELDDAMARQDLLAPCTLYSQVKENGVQYQELNAPLFPLDAEPEGSQQQVRFPVFTLAW